MPAITAEDVHTYARAAESKLQDFQFAGTPQCLDLIDTIMRVAEGDKYVAGGSKTWVIVLRHMLARAIPYYFTPELNDLIEAGGTSLFDHKLSPYDMPGPSGYYWYKQPIAVDVPEAEDEKMQRCRLHAISWACSREGFRNSKWLPEDAVPHYVGCEPTAADSIVFALWLSFPDALASSVFQGRVGGHPIVFMYWPIGESIADMQIKEAGRVGADGKSRTSISMFKELSVLLSSFLFMQQKLIRVSQGSLPRQTRKHIEQYDSAVDIQDFEPQIVAFRKIQRVSSQPENQEHGIVEWSCRWLTSGHWRNQPYHDGVKKIWISPYVKGPEDKPFKVHAGKIGAVIR